MRLYKKKNGWFRCIGFKWPGANWYGILSLILMASLIISALAKDGLNFNITNQYIIMFQTASTLFLFKGFVYTYLQKEDNKK